MPKIEHNKFPQWSQYKLSAISIQLNGYKTSREGQMEAMKNDPI